MFLNRISADMGSFLSAIIERQLQDIFSIMIQHNVRNRFKQRQDYFGTIHIGTESFTSYMDSIVLPKSSIKSDLLELGLGNNTIYFTFDPESTVLNIYLNPVGSECGVNGIHHLKKTKHGYMNKSVVYDEIKDKPWKKGKKRVVRHYYQLRS